MLVFFHDCFFFIFRKLRKLFFNKKKKYYALPKSVFGLIIAFNSYFIQNVHVILTYRSSNSSHPAFSWLFKTFCDFSSRVFLFFSFLFYFFFFFFFFGGGVIIT